jgi:hypothetical protein
MREREREKEGEGRGEKEGKRSEQDKGTRRAGTDRPVGIETP